MGKWRYLLASNFGFQFSILSGTYVIFILLEDPFRKISSHRQSCNKTNTALKISGYSKLYLPVAITVAWGGG